MLRRRPTSPRERWPRLEELERRQVLSTGPLHFDFGTTNSPAAQGYVEVSPVAYSSSRGYGWKSLSGLYAQDRGTADPLTRDFHRSHDATFLADLSTGIYDITVTLGDPGATRDNVSIWIEGRNVASNVTTRSGETKALTFRHQVRDGQLALRLVDTRGSSYYSYYFAIDGLDIVPVGGLSASAGAPVTSDEGSSITFSGSASGGVAPLSYLWDFGDGTSAWGSLNPVHAYRDNGNYTVTLTATDALGATTRATTATTVRNAAPTIPAFGPFAGSAGSPTSFRATASDPSSVDTAAGLSYIWDFGDGTTGSGEAPSHAYGTPGSYTVTVKVTDKDGGWATSLTTVRVDGQRVFISTNGVYALETPNLSTPRAVLDHPDVAGVALRSTWDAIEIGDRVYDWSHLDTQIAAAAAAGKKVSLSIWAGDSTPAWVYAAGARSFRFVEKKSPDPKTIPVPWDPIFLAKWRQFVEDLGGRYAWHPAVSHVKLTGINTRSPETKLPSSKGEQASNGTTTWTTTNDVANWRAIGYTRARVADAWRAIADTFSRSFPSKQIAIEIVPSGFPPIDDDGELISWSADYQLVEDMIHRGIDRYGSQFIVQNDGLSAFWISSMVTSVAHEVTTGFQMLWWVTDETTYRMNNDTPGDSRTVLQAAVDRAIAGNAKYLEIYRTDIINPDLRDVIAGAREGLLANAVPTATITGAPASGRSQVGTGIVLGSTIADPSLVDPSKFAYVWNVSKDGNPFAAGSGPVFLFRPDGNGVFTVSLTVTNANGRRSPVSLRTITVG